jgi:hypothetical protein
MLLEYNMESIKIPSVAECEFPFLSPGDPLAIHNKPASLKLLLAGKFYRFQKILFQLLN